MNILHYPNDVKTPVSRSLSGNVLTDQNDTVMDNHESGSPNNSNKLINNNENIVGCKNGNMQFIPLLILQYVRNLDVYAV